MKSLIVYVESSLVTFAAMLSRVYIYVRDMILEAAKAKL